MTGIKIKRIDFIVIILLGIFFFSFLLKAGTVFSGYHFIDDHTIINLAERLRHQSTFQVVTKAVEADLLIRFRPIFYPYLIGLTSIFGVHFVRTAIFVSLIGFATMTFFYLGMKRMGKGLILSALFPLLILGGAQMAVFWRSGVNETIGLFFFSITFFFMASSMGTKNYQRNTIFFVIFIIISSLCKESFIFAIPALLLFKVFNEANCKRITIKQSMKNNKLLAFPAVIMIVELILIKYFVGTNKIGYAGIASSWTEFAKGVEGIIFGKNSLGYWFVVLLALIAINALNIFLKKITKEEIKNRLVAICFSLLIIIPQILIHAKSGMVERYLVPATFGFSFAFVVLVEGKMGRILKILSYSVILVFITFSYSNAFKRAEIYAIEGRDANRFFRIVKANTKQNSSILLVIDPVKRFEATHSIRTYLDFYGYKQLSFYPLGERPSNDFEFALSEQWKKEFKKAINTGNGRPDLLIFFDKGNEEKFFENIKFPQTDYTELTTVNDMHSIYKKSF